MMRRDTDELEDQISARGGHGFGYAAANVCTSERQFAATGPIGSVPIDIWGLGDLRFALREAEIEISGLTRSVLGAVGSPFGEVEVCVLEWRGSLDHVRECSSVECVDQSIHDSVYARFMPIRIGIICENCERVYVIAHPKNEEHIQFNQHSDPRPPYRLKCACRTERHFGMDQTLPYRVSEFVCSRGYADRHEYNPIPIQQSK